MEERSRYATKKKGKTEVFPFWNMEDITNIINWFKYRYDWDGYLTTMFGLLLGRRIGDTISMKWSDLYYENGKRKKQIDTIEEQKTNKVTIIPISPMVFEAVDLYLSHKNVDILEHYNDFIFNIPTKSEWVKRKYNSIYLENDIEKWCSYFKKDFSEKRKQSIIDNFNKQNEYKTLGEYLYNYVELMDIIKWQVDGYRRKFVQAANECGIEYNVSCHSLRKTFGYITKMIHPYDVNCMETLQDIFNHSDIQTTMHYIGLSEEKKRQYFNDMGDVIRKIEQGNTDININNSPIVSLRHEDLRNILIKAIGSQQNGLLILNNCLKLIDEYKIKTM